MMKTKIRTIAALLILACAVLPGKTRAQSLTLKPVDSLMLKGSDHHFQQVFYDPGKSHLVRFFSDPSTAGSADKETQKTSSQNALHNGLIYGVDQKYNLGNLESPLAFFSDTLITLSLESSSAAVLKKYHFSEGKMNLVREEALAGLKTAVRMPNGCFLASDQYERNGQTLFLLDRQFKKVSTYQPFAEGFENLESGSNGKEALAVFRSASLETPKFVNKLVLFEASTGKVLKEKTYSKAEMDAVKIEMAKDYFYIYSSVAGMPASLWCLDKNLDLLWKKDMLLPSGDFTLLEEFGQLLAVTPTKVMALNMLSGAVMWQTSPVSFYHQERIEKQQGGPAMETRILSVNNLSPVSKGSILGIFYAQTAVGKNPAKSLKYSNAVSLVNMKGELMREFSLEGPVSLLEVFVGKGKLWVITEKNLRSYEIINH